MTLDAALPEPADLPEDPASLPELALSQPDSSGAAGASEATSGLTDAPSEAFGTDASDAEFAASQPSSLDDLFGDDEDGPFAPDPSQTKELDTHGTKLPSRADATQADSDAQLPAVATDYAVDFLQQLLPRHPADVQRAMKELLRAVLAEGRK